MKQEKGEIIQEIQRCINAVVAVNKEMSGGYSKDIKLYIKDEYGREFLVKIALYSQLKECEKNFKLAKMLFTDCIHMAKPLIITTVKKQYVITIFTWIDGKELRDCFVSYTESQQYNIGIEAGKNLHILHRHQKESEDISWFDTYKYKVENIIYNYKKCGVKFNNDKKIIEFIHENIELLNGRTIVLKHGDYHDGNLIIDKNGKLGVIDYNRIDWGDPWQEFDKIIWTLMYSKEFPRGMIDGYFRGKVPLQFFGVLELYLCITLIYNLPWAINYNKKNQVNIVLHQEDNILRWYKNFSVTIPTWYNT